MADDSTELRVAYWLGALEGVMRSGEDLLGRAQNLAPKDEGTLRASGALTLIINGVRFEGAGAYELARQAVAAAARAGGPCIIEAEVSFNTVYAARQHEELDWHHDVGEAKYLERPLTENARRYARAIELAAEHGLS